MLDALRQHNDEQPAFIREQSGQTCEYGPAIAPILDPSGIDNGEVQENYVRRLGICPSCPTGNCVGGTDLLRRLYVVLAHCHAVCVVQCRERIGHG